MFYRVISTLVFKTSALITTEHINCGQYEST